MMPLPTTDPTRTVLTAGVVAGRATGALFFLGFGPVWLWMGLAELHRTTPPALLLLLLLTIGLIAAALWLLRRSRNLPPGALLPEQEERTRRMFTAVNIIQWVSVATAIAILNILHQPAYIAPSIAIIVGLHLFPLAESFHYRQHHITGAAVVLWAVGCIALLPRHSVSGTCAVGTGVILLVSAASTVLRCMLSVRGIPAALPAELGAA